VVIALLILLAAPLYSLPKELPQPDAAQAKRIERALADLRGTARERGAREIALVGRPALRAVVARLNEADSAERVLLLTAVGRLPEMSFLIEQARKDPAPEVRALADPPDREPRSLAQLAARYIDLLALTRNAKREDVTRPLYELKPRIARPKDQYDAMRAYLGDEEMDRAVQGEYEAVSWQFARAGAAALRGGTLKPDLADPIFVAYLGLLYDEEVAASPAIEGVVAAGSAVAPALTQLLARKEHDPRLLARLLVAVGAADGLYGAAAKARPELRFAQIEMAPRAMERDPAIAFLTAALDDPVARNRKGALAALLELKAPVGELPRTESYGDDEWALALQLRVLANDWDALMRAAVAEDAARRGFERVLHGLSSNQREQLLPRLLAAEDRNLRWRAVDLMEDATAVLAIARANEDLRERAVRRAIRLKDASGLALLGPPNRMTVRALRENGFLDELVAIALGDDETASRDALRQLRHAPALPRKHEQRLLERYRGLPEPQRWDALDALVPLGTDAVRSEVVKSGERALGSLGVLADDGHTLPFAIPLTPFLEGADAQRLQKLGRLATAMPELEPGFFLKLLEAWDKVEVEAADVDGGAARQKIDALRFLVRSPDAHSVSTLFAEVLSGKTREESMVVAILQASARQLDAKTLSALIPLLEREVMEYAPAKDGMPPDPSPKRDYLVWYGMRALSYRQVEPALEFFCRLALEPRLQRERFDEQTGRELPIDWTTHAVEALRHYDASSVTKTLRRVIGDMASKGELSELAPTHLFRLVGDWRAKAWRGRRLHGFALTLCDLIDRYPFEGETGIARMLALGAQRRYVDAAAAGRQAAARIRARGYRPADGNWSPSRIEGRASIYEALANKKIPELLPELHESYLQWIAGIYLRFLVGDDDKALVATREAWRNTAWLNRDRRNLRAELMTRKGFPEEARQLMQPRVRLPIELRQDEGWYRYYLARALAAAGKHARAKGELSEALRINRRLVASCKVDPLLKGYGEVFRQADEDYFDLLFQD
jgi:hypothetical protein